MSLRKVSGICFALAALNFAVFGQTLKHEFVNYDDDQYVCDNPAVRQGLTWACVLGLSGQRSLDLASATHNKALVESLRAELALYQARNPWRETLAPKAGSL